MVSALPHNFFVMDKIQLGELDVHSLKIRNQFNPGFKRTAAFSVSLNGVDGSGTAFTDGDCLQELGTLDTYVDPTWAGVAPAKIVVEHAVVHVSEAAGSALTANISLSATGGTAVNAALTSPTEVVGAGATYAAADEGSPGTEADLNLNSEATQVAGGNVVADIAKDKVYLVATSALGAALAAGTATIIIDYYIV